MEPAAGEVQLAGYLTVPENAPRKLQHSTGFDAAALRTFAEDIGFTDEARWLARQLLHIENGQAPA